MHKTAAAMALVLGLTATTANAQASDSGWVDGLIEATGIPNQFENISRADDLAVRHRPSGLECHFGPEPMGRLLVFDNPNVPRGDDVGCNVHAREIVVSFAVTRARSAPALDVAAPEFFSGLYRVYPDAKPFTFAGGVPGIDLPGQSMPPVRIHRFTFGYRGQPMFSRAAMAIVGDWIVEQRTSAPQALADPAELFAQITMQASLEPIVQARPAQL